MQVRRTIACQDCGAVVEKRGPGQRYCRSCSARRDLVRKRLWARRHPPSATAKAAAAEGLRRRTELSRQAGRIANLAATESIAWRYPDAPDLLWLVRVAVPFSYAASKNHLYTMRRQGHLALRREVVAKRREIASAIRAALKDRRVAHNKLWIDIYVQKPNHKGDAVNMVDLVCDAIKDATGLDDRWYSIRALDWQIVKTAPRLFIGIGQDSDRDCQVCSYCGQIKELSAFTKQRHNHLGVGRECKDCRRVGRKLRKQRLTREEEESPTGS